MSHLDTFGKDKEGAIDEDLEQEDDEEESLEGTAVKLPPPVIVEGQQVFQELDASEVEVSTGTFGKNMQGAMDKVLKPPRI